jgi:hypothetical protein
VALDELAGGEVKNLGLVELGIEAEVEALEGLGGSKALRRSRSRSLLWARRSTSSCSRTVRNSTKEVGCSTA